MAKCRRCKYPKVKTITTRTYSGGHENFTDTVVARGTICQLDDVCWMEEKVRLREEHAASLRERLLAAREAAREARDAA